MLKAMRIAALALPLIACAFALAGAPASASQLPFYSSGLIDQTGKVNAGTGFTVQHTGTGTYVITYPTSTGFASFPLMTVTPFGYNGHATMAIIAGENGANGGASFTIQLVDSFSSKKLKLVDNAFDFTLIAS